MTTSTALEIALRPDRVIVAAGLAAVVALAAGCAVMGIGMEMSAFGGRDLIWPSARPSLNFGQLASNILMRDVT